MSHTAWDASAATRGRSLLLATVLVVGACVTTEHQAGPPPEGALTRGPDPRAGMPRVQKRPAVKKADAVPRGMRVVTTLDPGDPLVNVRAMFLSGSRHDPRGKEGITALAARLMAEGTERLSGAELRSALFPWAAELSVQVDKETTVFIGRVHRDHLDAFFQIFTDVVLHPRLDNDDFERLKSRSLHSLATDLRQGNDEALQREALETLLYDDGFAPVMVKADSKARVPAPSKLRANHPYRHTPTGTIQGLTEVSLDDVRSHITRVFSEDRLVLGVGGGAPLKFVHALKTTLAALPDTGAHALALPAAAPPFSSRALVIDKKTPGTAISVGFAIDVDRAHPDYPAMKVAEAFFGEHRNRVSWLFQAMREKRGLNYGDYAYVEHFVEARGSKKEMLNIGRRQQYFSIWIRPVEHANRHFALKQAVYELDRFWKRGIPDDETFRRLLTFLIGNWQQKEQEPMRTLGYAMDDAFYGTGYGRDGLRERVLKLTRAEVNDAIKRHLRADRLHIVVVTEGGAQLAEELIANAPASITYPAEKGADILDEDKLISVFPLGLKRHSVRVIAPDGLFER